MAEPPDYSAEHCRRTAPPHAFAYVQLPVREEEVFLFAVLRGEIRVDEKPLLRDGAVTSGFDSHDEQSRISRPLPGRKGTRHVRHFARLQVGNSAICALQVFRSEFGDAYESWRSALHEGILQLLDQHRIDWPSWTSHLAKFKRRGDGLVDSRVDGAPQSRWEGAVG